MNDNIREQLRDCIENGTPFIYKNVRIIKVVRPEWSIDSLHYEFLVPSNLDKDCRPLKESASLIQSGLKETYNIDKLIEVLLYNEKYFTDPLGYIAKVIDGSRYKDDYLKEERSRTIYKYLKAS